MPGFAPVNRIGHFYYKPVEEPMAIWREFCESAIDFALDWDETAEERDEVALADDALPWDRWLAIVTREALRRRATSVEFCSRTDQVAVHYARDGGQDDADTLSRGAYESLIRYIGRIADGDRIEVTIEGSSVAIRVELTASEHGQRMRLLLPTE